ncbi:hypothetical protein B0H14DRAFT_2570964 [Mycena olivaceomarginata]|nr:hypothetical protein B0H14DRAFT_2570964 [Mycena olivaceomarginata]
MSEPKRRVHDELDELDAQYRLRGGFAVDAEVAQPKEVQKEVERDCGICDNLLALGHPSQALTHTITPPPLPTRAPLTLSVQDSSFSSDRGSTTDYSLLAIIRARTLQTRRHVSHPFSSLVGVRAALGPLGWAVVWVVLVRGGGVRLGAPVRD